MQYSHHGSHGVAAGDGRENAVAPFVFEAAKGMGLIYWFGFGDPRIELVERESEDPPTYLRSITRTGKVTNARSMPIVVDVFLATPALRRQKSDKKWGASAWMSRVSGAG